ncbi:protein mono-ADP-ribosyltransferase PARP14-like isoform X2 [Haliotis cracherodii]|uniref:protein mono-ADP-ribosyltransferase PARP14-like isoform X2 n=1 Tax=Haliotis cracherodii TaxID=6455 RepID=UPI0039EAF9C0
MDGSEEYVDARSSPDTSEQNSPVLHKKQNTPSQDTKDQDCQSSLERQPNPAKRNDSQPPHTQTDVQTDDRTESVGSEINTTLSCSDVTSRDKQDEDNLSVLADSKQKNLVSQNHEVEEEHERESASFHSNSGKGSPLLDTISEDASLRSWVNISSTSVSPDSMYKGAFQDMDRNEVTSFDNSSEHVSPAMNANKEVPSHQRATDAHSDDGPDSSPNHNDNDDDQHGPSNPMVSSKRETDTDASTDERDSSHKHDDNDDDLYGPLNPLANPEGETDKDSHTIQPDGSLKHDDKDDDLYGPPNDDKDDDLYGPLDDDNGDDLKGAASPLPSPESETGTDDLENDPNTSLKHDNNEDDQHRPSNPLQHLPGNENECDTQSVESENIGAVTTPENDTTPPNQTVEHTYPGRDRISDNLEVVGSCRHGSDQQHYSSETTTGQINVNTINENTCRENTDRSFAHVGDQSDYSEILPNDAPARDEVVDVYHGQTMGIQGGYTVDEGTRHRKEIDQPGETEPSDDNAYHGRTVYPEWLPQVSATGPTDQTDAESSGHEQQNVGLESPPQSVHGNQGNEKEEWHLAQEELPEQASQTLAHMSTVQGEQMPHDVTQHEQGNLHYDGPGGVPLGFPQKPESISQQQRGYGFQNAPVTSPHQQINTGAVPSDLQGQFHHGNRPPQYYQGHIHHQSGFPPAGNIYSYPDVYSHLQGPQNIAHAGYGTEGFPGPHGTHHMEYPGPRFPQMQNPPHGYDPQTRHQHPRPSLIIDPNIGYPTNAPPPYRASSQANWGQQFYGQPPSHPPPPQQPYDQQQQHQHYRQQQFQQQHHQHQSFSTQQHHMPPGSAAEQEDCMNQDTDYKREKEPLQTILVEGITPDLTEDVLEMYFENKKRSGGGDIQGKMKMDKAKKAAYITYEIARRVAEKEEHKCSCHVLKVSLYDPVESPSELDTNTIAVTGFPSTMTLDTLEMYFENKRHSRGGNILEASFSQKKDVLYIKFEKEGAAKDVVAKTDHTFEGHPLTVTLHRPKAGQTSSPKAIAVTGFGAKPDDDTLQMYFESKKKSGGGEFEKYQREKGVIYITFEKEAVADRVLEKREHTVGGVTLTVVKAGMEELDDKCDADNNDEEPATTIEIRGYDKAASNDSISLYFENKRKSGGGPTIDLKRNDKKGVIYITFETEEVAERVVNKEQKQSGRLLQVKLATPQVMYKDKVLLTGVPPMESYETLSLYLEAKTELEVQQLLYGEEDGDVLVTFSEDIKDFELMKERMKEKPFKQGGKEVAFNIDKVPETSSITVWDIKEEITEDQLRLYFENTKRSGGADVEDVISNSQERYAVIKFQDAKVAESVYKRKHKLQKLPVEVSLNFECLGESGGTLEPPCSKLPDAFTVCDLEEYKFRHLVENNVANVSVKEIMANVKTDIDMNVMNRNATFTPTFSLNTPDARSICKTWRKQVEATFTAELDSVKVQTVSVSSDIWTEVQSKMKEVQLPLEIQLFSDKGRVVVITGPEEKLPNIFSEIQETIDGMQTMYDRKKNEIVDKIPIKPPKLRLLLLQGILESVHAEDLCVDVDVDKGELVFTGQKDDVQSGKMKVYEELSKIQQQTIVSTLTQNQVELLHHGTVSEVLVKKLQDQPSPLNGSWEPAKEGVTVYYTEEDKIGDVLRYISTSLKEITLPLDDENLLLLPSKKFKEFMAELTKAHEDRIIITPESKKRQITVTAVSRDCESVESVLQKFIQGNSIYTLSYKCDAFQLKFVILHCEDELDEIEHQLEQFCVNFERRNNDPDFALTLKSTKAGQLHAMKLIDCITKRIITHTHVMSRPGLKAYLEGATSDLQRVERDTRCVISLKESINDNAEDLSEDDTPMTYDVVFVCYHKNEGQLQIAVGDLVAILPDVDVVVVEVTPGLNSDSEQACEVISRAGDGAVSEVRGLSVQIAEGDVVSSSAGALSCRMIIYAVGPTGKNNPEEVIKTLVKKSLKLVAKKNMRSLALPAFNTQLASSYLCSEDAMKAVVEAVNEFFNDNPQGSVNNVYLCTEDWQQCAPVWNIAIDAFGEGNVKGTEGGMEATDSLHGGRRRGMGHRRSNASNRYENDTIQEDDFGEASGGLEEESRSPPNRMKPRILLVKADMGVEEADVIVNSSNTHLNLGQGQVSKSLLKHAGKAIQIECKEKYPQGVSMGAIAVTKGGDMQCVEQIYHCVLPPWNAITGKKTFTDTLNALLKKTHQSNWKTMAIPALGTGNLGYSRDLVAKLMYDTVVQFGKDNPDTTINDVLFIVYPGDAKTIQAFEAEHRKYIALTGGKLASSQKEIDEQRMDELEAYRDQLKSDKAKRDKGASMTSAIKAAVGSLFNRKEKKSDKAVSTPVQTPRASAPSPKQPSATRTVPNPSDVKVWIYTDDDANVTKAVDKIYKDWDSKAERHTIDKEESIKVWSPDEINDLKKIEQKCGISITANKALGRIVLFGLKHNVTDATGQVYQMIRELERKRKEEEYADDLQRVVQWSFVELTEEGEDKVVDYDKKVNVMLERAYTKQQKTKLEYEGYTFDFTKWEEYPTEDVTDTVTMIRRDKVSGASAHFPSTWVGTNSTDDVKIVQVQNGTQEFTRVHQTFTDAVGNMLVQIRRIDRVQSKTLYQQYQAKKQQLEKQITGTTVERTLWHGTPQGATMSIMTYGFNRSYCDKDSNALGEGAYFTSDAAYASRDRYAPADGQGNRHMFLCKVLTGSYTQGQPKIRTPPQKDPAKQELYDSVVDDPANPKIFVVFSDTQAYPEYLISFQ